uniref:Uncharacterized protein n=1 Tax=Rhizophora mucronata TaxID=61149 RepID=A0A2P2K4M0_RHIMU
MPKLLHDVQNC